MRQEMTISARLDQKMILAPRMIQSMEILQLPIMALQERIQQELQENPVLELKDTNNDESAPDFDPDAEVEEQPLKDSEPLVIDEAGDNEQDFDRLEAMNRDWEDH